jgi:hypothetical protein
MQRGFLSCDVFTSLRQLRRLLSRRSHKYTGKPAGRVDQAGRVAAQAEAKPELGLAPQRAAQDDLARAARPAVGGLAGREP